MSLLRSVAVGALALTAGFSLPAKADPNIGFSVGPHGARIYVDDDRYRGDYYGRNYYRSGYDHYRYHPYRHSYHRPYRRCHSESWYSWRWGERVRVVDRVCYNRWGVRYIADRDYYPIYGHRRW